MTRWNTLKDLFDKTIDLPPHERENYLDQVCADDTEMRKELTSLLEANQSVPGYLTSLKQQIFEPAETSSTHLQSGHIIGHYEIIEKLGSGSMGIVYRARDLRLGRSVALKFIPPQLRHEEELRERFVREARAASILYHPNICTIYDVSEIEDQYFIAMAYCDGETLKQKLSHGPIAFQKAFAIGAQIARGLAKSHASQIVHRDVKPANIIFTKDGVVKIVDFGLAKVRGSDQTLAGMLMGTVAYMAPEQIESSDIDHRADIWALGVVLYEMIFGKRPFTGDNEQAMMYSILHHTPAFSTESVRTPPHVEAILQRLLAKDPVDRYQHVSEFLEDLEADATPSRRWQPVSAIDERPTLRSIAILPFADLSPLKDQEYFSDGIAEELSNALARIPGWKVVARSSSFSFKDKNYSIPKIGRLLNVNYLLEGSLRKAESQIRINVQLIDARDGFQIWSLGFNRTLEDVFAIQEEIARNIVDKLSDVIDQPGPGTLVKKPTKNLPAYNLYLKARHQLNRRTLEGLANSQKYCRQALSRDPSFAPAYACLADAYILSGLHDAASPHVVMPQAREAAEKALSLDPELVEAHTTLGCIAAVYEKNWAAAETSFQTAFSINSGHSTTYHWYATWYCWPRRNFADARESLEKALELDPLSLNLNASLGWHLYFEENYDEAITVLKQTLELEPGFVMALDILGQSYLQQGRVREAIETLRESVERSNGRTLSVSSLAHALALDGKTDEAGERLDVLRQRSREAYVSAYHFAVIHAGCGAFDLAMDALEEADEEHSGWLCFLDIDPRFQALRSLPRYDALRKRLNLN